MRVSVVRKNLKFVPDSSRVVARYFMNGESRSQKIVAKIMTVDENQVSLNLEHTLREFAGRHRNISRVFLRHCASIQDLIEKMEIDFSALSDDRKMLIGSYCTMEYAIESAAIFNPSIVEDFDQSGLEYGEKRVIISFRATGEGHISSIVFRRGILDKDNNLQVMKMAEMHTSDKYSTRIMQDLPDEFEYGVLKNLVNNLLSDPMIRQERRTA